MSEAIENGEVVNPVQEQIDALTVQLGAIADLKSQEAEALGAQIDALCVQLAVARVERNEPISEDEAALINAPQDEDTLSSEQSVIDQGEIPTGATAIAEMTESQQKEGEKILARLAKDYHAGNTALAVSRILTGQDALDFLAWRKDVGLLRSEKDRAFAVSICKDRIAPLASKKSHTDVNLFMRLTLAVGLLSDYKSKGNGKASGKGWKDIDFSRLRVLSERLVEIDTEGTARLKGSAVDADARDLFSRACRTDRERVTLDTLRDECERLTAPEAYAKRKEAEAAERKNPPATTPDSTTPPVTVKTGPDDDEDDDTVPPGNPPAGKPTNWLTYCEETGKKSSARDYASMMLEGIKRHPIWTDVILEIVRLVKEERDIPSELRKAVMAFIKSHAQERQDKEYAAGTSAAVAKEREDALRAAQLEHDRAAIGHGNGWKVGNGSELATVA